MTRLKLIVLIISLFFVTGCQSKKFDPFPNECRTTEYERYKYLYDAFDQGMVYAYSYVSYFSFLEENHIPKPEMIYLFTSDERNGIEFIYNCDNESEQEMNYCEMLKNKDVKGCPYVDLYGEPVIFDGVIKYQEPYYFSAKGTAIDVNGDYKELSFNFYITPDGLIVLDELSDLDDVDPFSPGYKHTGLTEPRDSSKKFTLDDKNLEYAWVGFSTGLPNFDLEIIPRFPIE